MDKINIFLDSSVLISGIISSTGAAHVLLQLGETEDIVLTISEFVLLETEASISKKSPKNLANIKKEIQSARIKIVPNPPREEVMANLYLIDDPEDVPILLAAIKAKVDYLATLDRKHFLKDTKVSERTGLRIGIPGDVLIWIRENLR